MELILWTVWKWFRGRILWTESRAFLFKNNMEFRRMNSHQQLREDIKTCNRRSSKWAQTHLKQAFEDRQHKSSVMTLSRRGLLPTFSSVTT
jgi:hypothetical protein